MKKLVLLTVLGLIIGSCSGVKKTQEAINTGSYSAALQKAITNLAANKTKKRNQRYILLLEEAFEKNAERELQHIAFLEKDGNAANYEAIYNSYTRLKDIQERIKPLLPLEIVEEGRNAEFSFRNYDNQILVSRDKLSDYLYENASELLANAQYKNDYRTAYADLSYLAKISPNYKDTQQKIAEAHQKGIDYVSVKLLNETDQIIPERLQADLLNFDTYGLNDLWTIYHAQPQQEMSYDYEMLLAFKNIAVSPEQVREKQLVKEKVIKVGYKYATDAEGNVVRDSLGNRIKIDKFKTVRCDFFEFTQFKAAQVEGDVYFRDLKTAQQISNYPIVSEFVFEHVYANYDGDVRALEEDLLVLSKAVALQFPTNEQMVYDAGEDIKSKVKGLLRQQRFQ